MRFVSLSATKTITWDDGLDARMRIHIHSSSMLQVNCPILHDVGLTPPLAVLSLNPPHFGIRFAEVDITTRSKYSGM